LLECLRTLRSRATSPAAFRRLAWLGAAGLVSASAWGLAPISGPDLVGDLAVDLRYASGSGPQSIRAVGSRFVFAAKSDAGRWFYGFDPIARRLEPLLPTCEASDSRYSTAEVIARSDDVVWYQTTCADGTQRLLRTDGTPEGSVAMALGRWRLTFSGYGDRRTAREVGGRLLALATDVETEALALIEVAQGEIHELLELGAGTQATSDLLAAGETTLLFTAPIESAPVETLWSIRRESRGEWEIRALREFSLSTLEAFTESADRILFVLRPTGTEAHDLWVSDGSDSGTARVGVTFAEPVRFTWTPAQTSGVRAFLVETRQDSSALWTTDGTRTGTWIVSESSSVDAFYKVAVVGSAAYFIEATDPLGESLRVADLRAPTPAATLIDFCPEPGGHSPEGPFAGYWPGGLFANVAGRLLFDNCAGNSDQVWEADPGTSSVRQLTDFCENQCSVQTQSFLTAPDRIVFTVAGPNLRAPISIWTLDGSAAGAVRLGSDFHYMLKERIFAQPLEVVAARALFALSDGKRGFEPWTADFTRASLGLVADLRYDAPGGEFGSFFATDASFFFVDRDTWDRSWRLDRKSGRVSHQLDSAWFSCSEIPNGQFNALPRFLELEHGVVIQLDDCWPTANLWTADATGDEARPLLRAEDHPDQVFDGDQLVSDGVLYLGFYGGAVWRTDGSAAGTSVLTIVDASARAVPLGAAGGRLIVGSLGVYGQPGRLVAVDLTSGAQETLAQLTVDTYWSATASGRIYFFEQRPDGYYELWATDGTAVGTQALATLLAGGLSVCDWVEVEGGHLLTLRSYDRALDILFTSGSAGGSHMAGRFPASVGRDPSIFADAGRVLVRERSRLWSYDPALHEFGVILELASAEEGLADSPGTALGGGWIYFEKFTAPGNVEIWRTLGTAASTSLVAVLPGLFYPTRLISIVDGSRIILQRGAEDGSNRLWSLDTTTGAATEIEGVTPLPIYPPQILQYGVALPDRLLFSGVDPDHGAELWQTDGTPAGTRRVADLNPGAASSAPSEFFATGDRVFFSADDGVHGRELWTLRVGDAVPCRASERTLCLDHDRFKVDLHYMDFQGNQGDGAATALSADTGYFTFFDPANVESVVKVLDGTGTNGHHWVFEGALTNLQTFLTVTDTATGEAKRYLNGLGNFASIGDPAAFLDAGAVASAAPSASARRRESSRRDDRSSPSDTGAAGVDLVEPTGHCAPASNRLCLQGNRFAVEASWRDFFGGGGVATAVPLTADTGYFWFFADSNVETMVKVLDGRGTNGRFWVFFGALSNVETTLTVTDTETGEVRTYFNPLGRFASVGDVEAF
jgi:ELWxxDGT repeat protein